MHISVDKPEYAQSCFPRYTNGNCGVVYARPLDLQIMNFNRMASMEGPVNGDSGNVDSTQSGKGPDLDLIRPMDGGSLSDSDQQINMDNLPDTKPKPVRLSVVETAPVEDTSGIEQEQSSQTISKQELIGGVSLSLISEDGSEVSLQAPLSEVLPRIHARPDIEQLLETEQRAHPERPIDETVQYIFDAYRDSHEGIRTIAQECYTLNEIESQTPEIYARRGAPKAEYNEYEAVSIEALVEHLGSLHNEATQGGDTLSAELAGRWADATNSAVSKAQMLEGAARDVAFSQILEHAPSQLKDRIVERQQAGTTAPNPTPETSSVIDSAEYTLTPEMLDSSIGSALTVDDLNNELLKGYDPRQLDGYPAQALSRMLRMVAEGNLGIEHIPTNHGLQAKLRDILSQRLPRNTMTDAPSEEVAQQGEVLAMDIERKDEELSSAQTSADAPQAPADWELEPKEETPTTHAPDITAEEMELVPKDEGVELPATSKPAEIATAPEDWQLEPKEEITTSETPQPDVGENVEVATETEITPDSTATTAHAEEVPLLDDRVSAAFSERLSLSSEQLESIPGFRDLSAGQQILALQNLEQFLAREAQRDAETNPEGREGTSKVRSTILNIVSLGAYGEWQKHKSQVAAAKARTSEDASSENTEWLAAYISSVHGQATESGDRTYSKEVGPDAELDEEGKVHIHAIPRAELRKEFPFASQEALDAFDRAADEYAHIPHDWEFGYSTLSSKDRSRYEKIAKEYQVAREKLVEMKAHVAGPEQAALYVNGLDERIRLNQHFNVHPDAEEALANMKDQNVWLGAAKDWATGKGAYMALGAGVRALAYGATGGAFAILQAAGVGGGLGSIQGWVEARHGQKRLREQARSGGDASVTHDVTLASGGSIERRENEYTDASFLAKRLDRLSTKLDALDDSSEQANAERSVLEEKIRTTLALAEEKESRGLINYGNGVEEIQNKVAFAQALGGALVRSDIQSDQYLEQLNKALDNRSERLDSTRKKEALKQAAKAGLLRAGFAAAGALIVDAFSNDAAAEINQEAPATTPPLSETDTQMVSPDQEVTAPVYEENTEVGEFPPVPPEVAAADELEHNIIEGFKADFGRLPTEVEVGILHNLHEHPNPQLEAQFRLEAQSGEIWEQQGIKYFSTAEEVAVPEQLPTEAPTSPDQSPVDEGPTSPDQSAVETSPQQAAPAHEAPVVPPVIPQEGVAVTGVGDAGLTAEELAIPSPLSEAELAARPFEEQLIAPFVEDKFGRMPTGDELLKLAELGEKPNAELQSALETAMREKPLSASDIQLIEGKFSIDSTTTLESATTEAAAPAAQAEAVGATEPMVPPVIETSEAPKIVAEIPAGGNLWNSIAEKLEQQDLILSKDEIAQMKESGGDWQQAELQRNHLIDELKDKFALLEKQDQQALGEIGFRADAMGRYSIDRVWPGDQIDLTSVLGDYDTLTEAVTNADEVASFSPEATSEISPEAAVQTSVEGITEEQGVDQIVRGLAAEHFSKEASQVTEQEFSAYLGELASRQEAPPFFSELTETQRAELRSLLDPIVAVREAAAEASAQALERAASEAVAADIDSLYGNEGIMGVFKSGGESSLDWQDLRGRDVVSIVERDFGGINTLNAENSTGIGFDNSAVIEKTQTRIAQLAEMSGLKPAAGQTFEDYMRAAHRAAAGGNATESLPSIGLPQIDETVPPSTIEKGGEWEYVPAEKLNSPEVKQLLQDIDRQSSLPTEEWNRDVLRMQKEADLAVAKIAKELGLPNRR